MPDSTTTTPARRFNPSAVSLWASALVILALVIVQAGRMDPGHLAFADVSEIGDLTILNADAGGGEDVVVILDRRDERVYVYGLLNRNPELLVAENLAELFTRAREIAGGGR